MKQNNIIYTVAKIIRPWEYSKTVHIVNDDSFEQTVCGIKDIGEKWVVLSNDNSTKKATCKKCLRGIK